MVLWTEYSNRQSFCFLTPSLSAVTVIFYQGENFVIARLDVWFWAAAAGENGLFKTDIASSMSEQKPLANAVDARFLFLFLFLLKLMKKTDCLKDCF